nr:glycosyltransferase family 4 protein [Candidatus Njordarchaeota archaeon]
MKVAHSVHHYGSTVSGSEEYMRNLSEELVKRSYDVTVLTGDSPRQAYEEELNGVRVRRYPSIRIFSKLSRLPVFAPFRGLRDSFSGTINTLWSGVTPRIYLDIVRGEYNLVHATPIPANSVVLSFLAARKAKIPFVCTPFFHYKMKQFSNELYIRILKNSDAVLVCTCAEGEVLSRLGVERTKIHKIAMGVNVESWKSVNPKLFRRKHGINSSPIILFAGSKTIDKGALHVLDAMKKVWEEIPEAYFVAIGGRNRHWIQALSRLSKQERRRILDLDLTKVADQQEKRNAFAACNLFVMPSITDAYGIVYLESWVCRKPVIAADTQVMREVVSNGRDGLLVQYGNTEELTYSITKLLRDENLRSGMGVRGYNRVLRNNTWSLISQRIIDIYEAIVR